MRKPTNVNFNQISCCQEINKKQKSEKKEKQIIKKGKQANQDIHKLSNEKDENQDATHLKKQMTKMVIMENVLSYEACRNCVTEDQWINMQGVGKVILKSMLEG